MNARPKTILLAAMLMLAASFSMAQIPVELMLGHSRASMDLMFFKFFKGKDQQPTKWLFFNRDRVVFDYRMTTTEYLPQFGITEAISYNHPKLHGLAPVMVGQASLAGLSPKAGIQFAHIRKGLTIFTWAVVETLRQPAIDHFALLRFTPLLSGEWHLYSQLESFTSFPTINTASLRLIQRLRLGIQHRAWQAGIAGDLSEYGRTAWTKTTNWGIFLRHEF